tara:strand:- start:1718 stop:2806 length:1089 start_codon:yes stop_codon:yes gene_type:complete
VINKNFLKEPNIVDLSKEIFKEVVQNKLKIDTRFSLLSDDVHEAETINFILADGLGYENLKSTDSYLNKNVTKSINTTFPSSTNVALSSIAFMKNPIEHGLIGYYMYDKSQYGLINALNWNEDNKNFLLSDHFKKQNSIWKIFKENKIYASNFQPRNLVGTPLSDCLYDLSSTIPYEDEQNLLELLSESTILENKFNFIYYPLIDVTAHIFGVNSEEWKIEIAKFEKLVYEISNISNKKTKTVISADHGLTNIDAECRHHLNYGEDLRIYGDQRSVYINGSQESVLETFSKVPGVLLEQNELSYLLGDPTNEFMQSIYPDFCFLVEEKNIIYPKHLSAKLKGYHGGLSKEELKIPIIELSNY